LYLVGGDNREYRWYSFTRGATSGSFTLNVPVVSGQYQFRYLTNNSYTSVAASNPINVQ
jgi:hypothetical protein